MVLAAVCAASASAAMVETVEDNDFIRFKASPSEQNRVTLSRGRSRTEVRVEERGAPLAIGKGCARTSDPQVASCHSDFSYVHLGDGDDRLTLLTAGIGYGGPGDDVLQGGPRPDYLFGGDGSDLLTGGGGEDVLFGDRNRVGELFDSYGPAFGNDRLDGGAGHDGLAGGPGDDRLSGGGGNDVLAGAGPPALMAGSRPAAGADVLEGGAGTDVAEYDFQPPSRSRARVAPELAVTLDGQANDGPGRGRDNVAADVERAYSLSAAFLVAESGRFGLLPIGQFARFGYRPRTGREPSVGARIYRLTAAGTAGANSGVFHGSTFTVAESRSARQPTTLRLPSDGFATCRARAGAHASGVSQRTIHRVRGSARGRFRTRGRYSAATVRGTGWSVSERCDGTLTHVESGKVAVRDFRRKRTIVLTAGQSYLARAPR